jgi:hypothetical protein
MSHDRTGERIDDDEPIDSDQQSLPLEVPPPHDPRCQKGWIGFDDEDRPIPCLQCRPKLAPEERRRALGLGDKY